MAENFIVGYAKDVEAEFVQATGPPFIVGLRFVRVMNRPVDLDDEPIGRAAKVHHERIDDTLTFELATETPTTQ